MVLFMDEGPGWGVREVGFSSEAEDTRETGDDVMALKDAGRFRGADDAGAAKTGSVGGRVPAGAKNGSGAGVFTRDALFLGVQGLATRRRAGVRALEREATAQRASPARAGPI